MCIYICKLGAESRRNTLSLLQALFNIPQAFLLTSELELIASDVVEMIAKGDSPAAMLGKWPASKLVDSA